MDRKRSVSQHTLSSAKDKVLDSGINRKRSVNQRTLSSPKDKVPDSGMDRKRSVNQHTLSSPKDKVDELHTMYNAGLGDGQKTFSQPTHTNSACLIGKSGRTIHTRRTIHTIDVRQQ